MRDSLTRADPETACRRVLSVVRWPVGGIRTHILYDYPALQAAGYRFTFVGPAEASFRVFAQEVRTWAGVEFAEAPVRRRSCRLWQTVRGLLRGGRYDLVHAHGLTAAAHVAVATLGLGTPFVVTSHDVFRPDQFAGFRGQLKRWLLGRAMRRAKRIVCVTDDARTNLLDYLPGLHRRSDRLVSIPYGIDMRRFAAGDEREPSWLRERLGLGDDVVLFGFLGRFMEQKGFLPLVEALHGLVKSGTTRVHLLAVGAGDFEREYRAEITRRGLADYVTFFGFIPDVGPILRQLDVMVMPSLWESAGILAMEALAAGIPVIGSACIGLREVLDGSPAVTVAPGDAVALSAALREAVQAPWTGAAREYATEAQERFSAARSGEQLRHVFDSLAPPSSYRAGRDLHPPHGLRERHRPWQPLRAERRGG
jgi:glycosyltransferase involved in cell wall biosynthesis